MTGTSMQTDGQIWDNLARQHGRKVVMSPHITDATLDAETARQIGVIFPAIAAYVGKKVGLSLDFGCGAGRFTKALADYCGGQVVGYDPSPDLIQSAPLAKGYENCQFMTGDTANFFASISGHPFDLIFTAMVLCIPHVDVRATAEGIARILKPGGTMVVVDHMAPDGKSRWVRIREPHVYRGIFSEFGIELEVIGHDRQLDVPITLMMGRRS